MSREDGERVLKLEERRIEDQIGDLQNLITGATWAFMPLAGTRW
jgi:hypothetical protein